MQSAGGYMASCVSRGRLALFSDNKTKVSDGNTLVQLSIAECIVG
jgi:hypothetical protein